jgi:branched-subunit amino acid ABC-type transport system permease component
VIKLGDLVFAGLTNGSIYAILALCVSVLFRVSGIINFAVGDFAMVGAMGAAFFVQNDGWNLALAIVVVLIFIGLFAYVFDLTVLRAAFESRRGYDKVTATFFYTLALSFFIEGVAFHMFGTEVHAAPELWSGYTLTIAGLHIQRAGVIIIGAAVVTGVGFAAFIQLSLVGKAVAACGENAFGARVVGIRQGSYRRGTFVAMSVLAGLFGIMLSPVTGFVYNSGSDLGWTGVVAAAFAGFTRPGRAVLMGIAIGLAEAFIGGYISTEYQEAFLYLGLVLIILCYPGVLGAGNLVEVD